MEMRVADMMPEGLHAVGAFVQTSGPCCSSRRPGMPVKTKRWTQGLSCLGEFSHRAELRIVS